MADNWDKLKQLKGQPESGNASAAAPANSSGSARPSTPVPAAPRTGGTGNYQQANRPGLPPGYLAGGYFYDNGNLKDELLVDHAELIARSLSNRPGNIEYSQLRKFYAHVRTADTRLSYGSLPFEAVRPSILQLKGFVAEASQKKKVPLVFKQFIDENVSQVKDMKTFRQGFVPHFQAVVAFFR